MQKETNVMSPAGKYSAKRLLVLFAALVFVLLLSQRVRPGIPVRITATDSGTVVTAQGSVFTIPGKSNPFVSLRLSVPYSAESVQWSSVRILTPGRPPETLSVPGFRFSSPSVPTTSDWWIDKSWPMPYATYEIQKDLVPPFEIEAIVTGRFYQPARLVLEGRSGLEVLVSHGFVQSSVKVQVGHAPVQGTLPVPATGQDFIGIASLALRSLAGGLILVIVFSLARTLPLPKDVFVKASSSAFTLAACFLSLSGFLLAAWVATGVLEKIPHFQDDMGYLLRAKWLLRGHLTQPVDELAPHLDVPFSVMRNGRWFIGYTIGWPALLSIGEFFRAPWIVAPLCGGLSLFLIYLLGKEVFDAWTGLIAASIACLSPLFGLLSGSQMSHAATGAFLLAFSYLGISGWRRRSVLRILFAGLSIGYAFCCRPLTAIAIALPHGIFFFWEALERETPERFRLLGVLAAAGFVGTLPVWIDNSLTTGSPFLFGLELLNQSLRLSNFPAGLHWADVSLAQLPFLLFGWFWKLLPGFPLSTYLMGIVLVPFLTRRASRHDVLLFCVFASLPLAYLCHAATGNHGYGPRFYYEGLFGLYLLAARGFVCLGGEGPEVPITGSLPVPALSLILVLLVLGSSLVHWFSRMELYRGYNFVSADLDRAVARNGISEGVIVLAPANYLQWIRASNLMPATWNDPLVVVGHHRDNRVLLRRYADREFYIWDGRKLRPWIRPHSR